MAQIIEFKLALEKEPDRERVWQYKPLSLKGLKKGKLPKFIVVEKGVGIIHLMVIQNEKGINFEQTERTEFSRLDSERAVGIIGMKIFEFASANGLLNSV